MVASFRFKFAGYGAQGLEFGDTVYKLWGV